MLIRASLAHLLARAASLFAGLVTIPLVTMTLGVEPLGLVGAYVTLQGLLALFDLGLPIAANHRLAVMSSRQASAAQRAAFVRAVEILLWGLAILFFLAGLSAHRWLAESWLRAETLSRETIEHSLWLIVAAVAVRFPVALYSNVLFGLDRHLYPNAVIASSAVIRTIVTFVALMVFGIGVTTFFIIQLVFNLAEVLLLAGGVWRGEFRKLVAPDWGELRRIGKTSAVLMGVSLLGVLLAQIDKVILSKQLSLGDFGIYVACYTLASGLLALSYPVGNAVFPQLTHNFERHRIGRVAKLVRFAADLTILLVVPLGAALVMQPRAALDLLFFVRPFPEGLETILPLMALGGIAHAMATLPHMYQIATGRPAVLLWVNAVVVLPYAVLIYMLTTAYGAWGAALAFAVLNAVRLFVYWAPLVLRRPGALAWKFVPALDLGWTALALAVSFAVAQIAPHRPLNIVIFLATIAGLTVLAAAAFFKAHSGRERAALRWQESSQPQPEY